MEWKQQKKKEVWVLVENQDPGAREGCLRLIGAMRPVCQRFGWQLNAGMVARPASALVQEAIYTGADRVIAVDPDYLPEDIPEDLSLVIDLLTKLAQRYQPAMIVMHGSRDGKKVAPRLACRLKTTLLAGCTGFMADPVRQELIWMGFSGEKEGIPVLFPDESGLQMVTMDGYRFPSPQRDETRSGEILIEKGIIPRRYREEALWLFAMKPETEEPVRLEDEKIIVAGGKGLGSKENFELLRRLASLLGGQVAGSKEAVEAGWIEPERQIGVEGKIVAPVLYIACGISGAKEHLAGLSKAQYIAAVNADPHAPIFEAADFGVVGDVQEILPAIISDAAQKKQIMEAVFGLEASLENASHEGDHPAGCKWEEQSGD